MLIIAKSAAQLMLYALLSFASVKLMFFQLLPISDLRLIIMIER